MKKILLVFILLFLVTGCTVNYRLTYEDGVFTEYLNIVDKEEDDAHPSYETVKNSGAYADITGKEKFKLDSNSTPDDIHLSHVLKDTKLKDLVVVSECFGLSTIEELDSSYYVYLYGDFTCQNLKNSKFILETDSEVLNHNATSTEDNKYIWNLTEEEAGKNGIKFQIVKSDAKKESLAIISIFPSWAKIVIFIIIVLVGGISILFLKRTFENK